MRMGFSRRFLGMAPNPYEIWITFPRLNQVYPEYPDPIFIYPMKVVCNMKRLVELVLLVLSQKLCFTQIHHSMTSLRKPNFTSHPLTFYALRTMKPRID